jgi:uncharacterized delta-60 repeat protein
MSRILFAALVALALAPATAQARPGDPDTRFGNRGTVTLKAVAADAVGGAVKVLPNNRVLAGGAAGGQFVVVKLRPTGSLDSSFGANGQVVPILPGSSLEGVRAIATFRDGRIVAAGTLLEPNGDPRMVAFRLLPSGEIDPSFGAGLGFVIAGPDNTELGSMAMDSTGNVILGGGRLVPGGGEVPVVMRLLADGSPDPGFAGVNVADVGALGLTGRATSVLARPDGTVTFTVGASSSRTGPATFTTVRLLPTGAPDPTFGGTGVVQVVLGPGAGAGIGAVAVRRGPGTTTLVAGTDMNGSGTPRGSIVRLRADGALDTRFGTSGIVHVARSGRDIRIASMVRDNQGRILLAGTARPPDSVIVRLRASGARDRSFGNRGLTYRVLGRPPGGAPVYTTFEAIDAAGPRAVLVGSAAGPGRLLRGGAGTAYLGRFALTVSKVQ